MRWQRSATNLSRYPLSSTLIDDIACQQHAYAHSARLTAVDGQSTAISTRVLWPGRVRGCPEIGDQLADGRHAKVAAAFCKRLTSEGKCVSGVRIALAEGLRGWGAADNRSPTRPKVIVEPMRF